MYCSNCGRKVKKEEEICKKCGNASFIETKQKEESNIFIKICMTTIIILFIVLVVFILMLFFEHNNNEKQTVNSETFLNEYYAEEFEMLEYKNPNIQVLEEEDINYNGYNKIAVAVLTVDKGNSTKSNVGVIIYNKEEKKAKSIKMDGILHYLLKGMYNNKKIDDLKKSVAVFAKYIDRYGEESISDRKNKMYSQMLNEVANIPGIEYSRNYIDETMTEEQSSTYIYILLFDKGSAYINSIAYVDDEQIYNDKYPIKEEEYKLYSRDSQYKEILESMKKIYGEPYVEKTVYVVQNENGNTYKFDSFEEMLEGTNSEVASTVLDKYNYLTLKNVTDEDFELAKRVVVVYLKDGLSNSEIQNIQENIKRMPNIESINYYSKEQMLESIKKALPHKEELLKDYDPDNIPYSEMIEVTLSDSSYCKEIARKIKEMEGITNTRFLDE